MLYNAVLVFTVQQSESAIGIYISLPLEPPTLPGHHRDPAELLVLHSCFPAAVYSAHGSVYVSMLLFPLFHPLLPQLWTQVRSLFLHFYSYPANRFICIIPTTINRSWSGGLQWLRTHLPMQGTQI